MILLAVYAVAVLYLALRFRRSWIGYVSVFGGAAVLLAIARGALGEHRLAALLPEGVLTGYRHMTLLLIPEAALILVVGLFTASLPRFPTRTQCQGCGYDLKGLDPVDLVCPECGAEFKGPGSGREEPPITLTPIPRGPVRRRVNL